MNEYCDRCHIRFGSQEKRVVVEGRPYHGHCYRREEFGYTLFPREKGKTGEAAIQHLQRPQFG